MFTSHLANTTLFVKLPTVMRTTYNAIGQAADGYAHHLEDSSKTNDERINLLSGVTAKIKAIFTRWAY